MVKLSVTMQIKGQEKYIFIFVRQFIEILYH